MRFLNLLFLVPCCGCSPPSASSLVASAHGQTTPQLRTQLNAVTVADGISISEAVLIGESYFRQNVGCGAFKGIKDGGDHWIVDALHGYAGQPVEGFFIDKRSGKVTSPIGPSYDDPIKILP